MFAAGHYLEERSRVPRITITQDQIGRVANHYHLQYGAHPSPEQLESLVDGLVKAEIFYREAVKLGLDANDEIVRRRLVQKYEFLLQDRVTPREPTTAQLLKHYHQHLDAYRRPETVTFTHFYFSPDIRGEYGARAAAQGLATKLNAKGLPAETVQGDRFPGPNHFTALSPKEVARVFGNEGFAEAILDAESERWTAPLRSGLGWHTAYVSARQPSWQVPFEGVRDDVRRDYLDAERNRRNAEEFTALRQRFEIIRE
jgi:hypothetical protein